MAEADAECDGDGDWEEREERNGAVKCDECVSIVIVMIEGLIS